MFFRPRTSVERLVSPIAARLVARVFTGTEMSVFVFLGREHVGDKRRPFMAAIAERLSCRESARAEGVLLSCFQRNFDRSLTGNRWFVRHGQFLLR